MLSTGARIEEVLSLRVENLRFGETPAIVSFEGQDSATKIHTREAILSREAAELAKNYLIKSSFFIRTLTRFLKLSSSFSTSHFNALDLPMKPAWS